MSSVIVKQAKADELTVFYAGRGMNGPETRYSPLEKMALALINAARRLHKYFQAHSMVVLTNQPLKQILQRLKHFGRLSKWAIELREFDIEFRPRTTMKVPNTIITDNGAQFNNQELISWAAEKELQIKFASVAHPQTKGQVEAANKKIKALLKKKLDEAKGLWAEKLRSSLGNAHNPNKGNKTSFCLTYGTEAILPVELMHPTAMVELFDPTTNDEGLFLDNDLLEEKRIKAHLMNLQNKQKEARFYNKRVRGKSFLVGD
ncbi:hypothetical protein ACLB2K_035074 [Fragaria x ananassa]